MSGGFPRAARRAAARLLITAAACAALAAALLALKGEVQADDGPPALHTTRRSPTSGA